MVDFQGHQAPTDARDFRQFRIFSTLEPEELQRIHGISRTHRSRAGEVLQLDGKNDIFLIWSGAVELFTTHPDGSAVLLRSMSKGDHFGEVAIYGEYAGGKYQAVVRTPGKLSSIPSSQFKILIDEIPNLRAETLRSIATLAMSAADRIAEIATLDLGARLRIELYRRATRSRSKSETHEVRPRPSARELGALLAAREAWVAQFMQLLEQDGLIVIGRNVIIIPSIEGLVADIDAPRLEAARANRTS